MTSFNSFQTTRYRKKTACLSDLDSKIADLRYKVSAFRFSTLLRKFDPEQPRDEQGRWTDGTGTAATLNPLNAFASFGNSAACNAQYSKDLFQCKMTGNPQCYAQAMVRFVACENGGQIPPLNY